MATLTLDRPDENDYTLEQGSCWITVGTLSVYIVRTDEGVVVDIYPHFRENDDAIAGTWALFSEAGPDEEDDSEAEEGPFTG